MKKQYLLSTIGIATALSFGVINSVNALDLSTGATEQSAEVTIQVTVTGETASGIITTPEDGAIFYTPKIKVGELYSEAAEVEYTLIYTGENEAEAEDEYSLPVTGSVTYTLPPHQVTPVGEGVSDGHEYWILDLDEYGGQFGHYVLTSTVNGMESTRDSVSFEYRALDIYDAGTTEEKTQNPIVTVVHAPGVKNILIQVYDKNGRAILDEAIEITSNGDDTTENVVLPLAKYGVPEGDYTVVSTPYDESGNILDINAKTTVHYVPAPAPNVPNTGGNLFSGLNFSNPDYITTGLCILFVTAFFAILILRKKNKDSRR